LFATNTASGGAEETRDQRIERILQPGPRRTGWVSEVAKATLCAKDGHPMQRVGMEWRCSLCGGKQLVFQLN
jgi:hypothetical protein